MSHATYIIWFFIDKRAKRPRRETKLTYAVAAESAAKGRDKNVGGKSNILHSVFLVGPWVAISRGIIFLANIQCLLAHCKDYFLLIK